MDKSPTLLVIPNGSNSSRSLTEESWQFNPQQPDASIYTPLLNITTAGFPVLLVAQSDMAEEALTFLPGKCIAVLPQEKAKNEDFFGLAVSLGVLSSSMANGWIISPIGAIPFEPGPVQQLAKELPSGSIVLFYKRTQQPYLAGFSSEFFSELIKIRSRSDLLKLISRYPNHNIYLER